MANDIKKNLWFLANNLSNIESILLHLIQNDVISQNESDEIKSKNTPLEKNTRLLEVVQKKHWPTVKELFLRILKITSNEHCANKIEKISNTPRQVKRLNSNLLKRTWWPKKKRLIKSLHERKIGDKLLVDELHDRLEKDENRMVVITESPGASKLTGMGGIGKTLTATWYAHKYEHEFYHVIWIDCGEGSLLTSFKNLARDLKIQDRNELTDVEEFARKCYEEIMHLKCLWIFDNAENYKGQGGMKKLLPNYEENFFCLITSRSSEWGIKNIGYGKITDLQLDIFSEQESLQFFKQNLEEEIKYSEFQLKELCRLLGNLPLAMQLAVAALNEGKIDLENYIKQTSSQDVENIVDAEFDDYEKTINASVKITLDVLEKEENGIVAKHILNIFGYIQPDDVIIDLFQEVLKLSIEDIQNGIELLVKFSLISAELKIVNRKTNLYVSIHRLLQQVSRHNGRLNENETLSNILGCNGFLDYELLPFTKYADDELRNEFPKVKAGLLDQQQLVRLVKERRFEESVQLSKFIDNELQRDATKFNYAICLQMNGQMEDEIKVLEELYQQDKNDEMNYGYYDDFVLMGLLRVEEEVSKCLVGGHLLISHWKMGNNERLPEIMEERKNFQIIRSQEMMNTIVKILDDNVMQFNNYILRNEGSIFEIVLAGNTKKIALFRYLADLSIPLPKNLQELTLERVQFKDANGKVTDFSKWLPKKLNRLEISSHETILSLGFLSPYENVTLVDCSLSLDSVNRISPKELKLSDISFVKNGKELSNVNVNEFVDFHKMKRLELFCHPDKRNLSIDLSEEESANIEYLHLDGVNVFNLKSMNGNGRVNIKEARIEDCFLNLSVFPPSLEKLSISDDTKVFEALIGGIDLPNLKYLKLESKDIFYLSDLPHFSSLPLSYVYLGGVKELNVDLLPTRAKIIRIDKRFKTRLIGGVIHLDKLILKGFTLKEVEEMLPHFHPKQLVLYSSFKPSDLKFSFFTLRGISVIAFGVMEWGKRDFSLLILSELVDQLSEYYVFQEGKGQAIEKKDFHEAYLLENIFEH